MKFNVPKQDCIDDHQDTLGNKLPCHGVKHRWGHWTQREELEKIIKTLDFQLFRKYEVPAHLDVKGHLREEETNLLSTYSIYQLKLLD